MTEDHRCRENWVAEQLVVEFHRFRTPYTWRQAATVLKREIVIPTIQATAASAAEDEVEVVARWLLSDLFIGFPGREPWLSWEPVRPFLPILIRLAVEKGEELRLRHYFLELKMAEEKWESGIGDSEPVHDAALLERCEMAVTSFTTEEFMVFFLKEYHAFSYEAIARCLRRETKAAFCLRKQGLDKVRNAIATRRGLEADEEEIDAAVFEALRRRAEEL